MKSLLPFAFLASAAQAAPAPANNEQKPQQHLEHANHIFNSIHSSMRQWGSSLNHNGMSVFIAEVPEDIEFYHGTSSPYRINGTEWLAFEPEHALMFARGFRGPPGGGKGRGPPGGPNEDKDGPPSPPAEPAEPVEGQEALESQHEQHKMDLRRHEQPQEHHRTFGQFVKEAFGAAVEQKPVLSGDAEERHGYLHTYRTKHPLRLLYVDGQSAAKSNKGTLDVQDLVLLHSAPPTGEAPQSMKQATKRSVDVEFEDVEPTHDQHDEPTRSGKGSRHYAIDGNNRNREWIARFFEGDESELELLPPPPEFREHQKEHHGPPPPWFHPHDGDEHDRHHPPPPPPPPEFARHHEDEFERPLPHHADDDEVEEHRHHGDRFDLLDDWRKGPPKHHRGPKFDGEPKGRHHFSILDWFRPHHDKDQHDSKFDGPPLFDKPRSKGGKHRGPKHDFDGPSDEKKDGQRSRKHEGPREHFEGPAFEHGRPHGKFDGPRPKHGRPDDHFDGPPPKHGRPDDHFDGSPPKHGRPDDQFDDPPPEHGEPHGPAKGAPHDRPHNCSSNDQAPSKSSGKDDEPRHHGPMSEGLRADRLCRLAREEWNGKVDGILRMEAGFEIILCDFEKHLDVVQIGQAKEDGGRGGPGGPGGRDSGEGLNSLKAVAARYDGIGGDRVKVNYDNFVSMYAYKDVVYFDDAGHPRVNNDTDVLKPVFSAIKNLAVSKPAKGPKKNWQATADMVVSRYADRIEYLASGEVDTLEAFKAETDRALRPFIDYGNRNATHEIARCAAQFPPSATSDKLAAQAIHSVSSIICRTFSKASEVEELSHGLSMLRGLKSWLNWSAWKKCRGCAVNEVCVIPIWPMGTIDDYEHPQCRSGMSGGPGGRGRAGIAIGMVLGRVQGRRIVDARFRGGRETLGMWT